jgi:hypothetical protein
MPPQFFCSTRYGKTNFVARRYTRSTTVVAYTIFLFFFSQYVARQYVPRFPLFFSQRFLTLSDCGRGSLRVRVAALPGTTRKLSPISSGLALCLFQLLNSINYRVLKLIKPKSWDSERFLRWDSNTTNTYTPPPERDPTPPSYLPSSSPPASSPRLKNDVFCFGGALDLSWILYFSLLRYAYIECGSLEGTNNPVS